MSKFDEEKISGSMKQQLREQMTRLRSELSPEERSERSRQACGHASELMKQHSFKSMMIYVPFRSELDTRPLVEWAWQEGIRVIVPRSIPKDRSMELYEIRSWDELAPGAYGIMEPDPKRVSKYSAIPPDVIWVPGLAFDPDGGRLGYGGGYYDRLSGALEPDSRTEEAEERGKSWWIGLGYEIQLVNQVPMDEHDRRLDGVITDKGYYRAGIRSQAEGYRMELSHFNQQGRARMVDVSDKDIKARTAVAKTTVRMHPDTLARIREGKIGKGDVLAVAQVAAIMAAKNTSNWIPMCHPLPLTGVNVDFSDNGSDELYIEATVKTTGKTGVEMEALTAVSAAALTVYDMCKALQKDMIIGPTMLVSKSGGKSGDYIMETT